MLPFGNIGSWGADQPRRHARQHAHPGRALSPAGPAEGDAAPQPYRISGPASVSRPVATPTRLTRSCHPQAIGPEGVGLGVPGPPAGSVAMVGGGTLGGGTLTLNEAEVWPGARPDPIRNLRAGADQARVTAMQDGEMVRKKCQRWTTPWQAHGLTFSCYRRQAFLSKERSRTSTTTRLSGGWSLGRTTGRGPAPGTGPAWARGLFR